MELRLHHVYIDTTPFGRTGGQDKIVRKNLRDLVRCLFAVVFDVDNGVFLVLQLGLQNRNHRTMARALQPHPHSFYHDFLKNSVVQ